MKIEPERGGAPTAPSTGAAPTAGPDAVGRAKAWLTREPPDPSGRVWTFGRAARAAGDVLLPGSWEDLVSDVATLPIGGGMLAAPLKRAAVRGLVGSAGSLLRGQELEEAAGSGALGFASQLTGEVLPGMLRYGRTQQIARPLLREHAAAVANRERKIAHDTAMGKTLEQVEREGYERDVSGRNAQHAGDVERARTGHAQALRDYATTGAGSIADWFKARVPALQSFPSTERGLYRMVNGSGPDRVSAHFDAALKRIVPQAARVTVRLPGEDAQRLGLKPTNIVFERSVDPSGRIADARQMMDVSAGEAIEAVTGTFKRDRGLYRRTVNAITEGLDTVDLGRDYQAARGAYRNAEALFEFADKGRIFDKQQRLDPVAVRAAFNRRATTRALRYRGAGNAEEGPFAQAVNRPEPTLRLPAEPAEIPKPQPRIVTTPSQIEPPRGVTTREAPRLGVYAHTPVLPAGIYLRGAQQKAPRLIATEAPMSLAERFALRLSPDALAQETSSLLGEGP